MSQVKEIISRLKNVVTKVTNVRILTIANIHAKHMIDRNLIYNYGIIVLVIF